MQEGVLEEAHPEPRVRLVRPAGRSRDSHPALSWLPSERACCAVADEMEPGRRTRSGFFVGTLRVSHKTMSDYFLQRKLDFHTSLNKNAFYF